MSRKSGRGRKAGLLGLVLAGIFALLAVAGPWLPLPDPAAVDLGSRLEPPHWTEAPILGTDAKGRDLLARLVAGSRVSWTVGLLGSLVALAVGVPWGAAAGLAGGRLDRWLMRIADGLESLPLVVVVLFLLSLLGEYRAELAAVGIGRLQVFYLAVGLLFWLPTARVARAEAQRLRAAGFAAAAAAAGAGPVRIFLRHLLPNMAPALLVMLGVTVPRVILMEAFLSFLGLGVEPPAVSWGLLAADGLAALNPLVGCWWLLAFPAAALSLSLLGLHLIADDLRDRLGRG
ncbi:MAG: ABC transporter permease [Planctomycetota bacterium]|nr:MAG: ABC transporter permease [Planctomycetota bacterium]